MAEAKVRLRRHILAARGGMDPQRRAVAAESLAGRVLELAELSRPTTVAAYVSFGTEPGTGPLLAALKQAGHRVLVPMLAPDRDLDWEHGGDHLGVAAIREARVVVCPGLAGDTTGARLGRGGGSYDRALARCGEATLRCLLLYDGEILDRVPCDDHDERVHLIVTPQASAPAVPGPPHRPPRG